MMANPVDLIHEAIGLIRVTADAAAANGRDDIHIALGFVDTHLQEALRLLDGEPDPKD